MEIHVINSGSIEIRMLNKDLLFINGLLVVKLIDLSIFSYFLILSYFLFSHFHE